MYKGIIKRFGILFLVFSLFCSLAVPVQSVQASQNEKAESTAGEDTAEPMINGTNEEILTDTEKEETEDHPEDEDETDPAAGDAGAENADVRDGTEYEMQSPSDQMPESSVSDTAQTIEVKPDTEEQSAVSVNAKPAGQNAFSTGLYEDPDGKWIYYKDGVRQKVSGVIRINGIWYWILNGVWQKGKSSVEKNENGWWCIKDGKVDFGYTGIAKNANGWWRIEKGKVNFGCNSVEQNENGWWYLRGGKVIFGYTGIAKNANGWWRIEKGRVNFGCNSVEQNENGWWKLIRGRVDFSFNGIAANKNGLWYLRRGRVDFGYNGTVSYNGRTYQVTRGKAVEKTSKQTTVADLDLFLQNAVKPAGNTLYVWGGGWGLANSRSGSAGVLPRWKTYFEKNRKGYSYRPAQEKWYAGDRSMLLDGLDCSGYVGWAVFNGVTKNRNASGYVTSSTEMASALAGWGFGTASQSNTSSRFLPGDIVSRSGHVYLCLGTCSDGSILLLHSTPNGGVQVSGTAKNGKHTVATKLAIEFMKNHYGKWWESFGAENHQAMNDSYKNGTKFTWDMSKTADSAGLRKMSGEQVLKYLDKYAVKN